MLKSLLFFAFISLVLHKAYRYYTFMGYWRQNGEILNYENGECSQKFKNISTDHELKWPITSTLDADMLPSGLSIFLSSNKYPLIDNLHKSTLNLSKNTIFMFDMNHIKDSEPFALNILNKKTDQIIEPNFFNLYALSMYQDKYFGVIKLIAANYMANENVFTMEKFEYHPSKHCLIHTNTFKDIGEICDLIWIDENIAYFSKCYSKLAFGDLKFSLELKNDEIFLLNLEEKHFYSVAKHLFMPKSLGYIKENRVLVVSNLAMDGLTLFKREFDNSLTKLQNIELNSFVFSIFVDFYSNTWVSTHPNLYQTLGLNSEKSTTSSKVIKLKFDFKYSQFIDYEQTEYFSTNGTLLNAMSASVVFKNSLILFSFLSDPRVCFIK